MGRVGRNRRGWVAAERGQGETSSANRESRGSPAGVTRNRNRARIFVRFDFPDLSRKLCKTAVGIDQLPVFGYCRRLRGCVNRSHKNPRVERELLRRPARRLALYQCGPHRSSSELLVSKLWILSPPS